MWKITFPVALGIISLDNIIKRYLISNFPYQSLPVIKNIFHITVITNQGAAFGLFQGKTTFLIFVALIFIIVFLHYIKREKVKNRWCWISYGFILGGAISNLFDRIIYGYVVDYLDFRIWPVFNLSDACITLGVGILLVNSFRKNKNA